MEALDVLQEEKMADNAQRLGEIFRKEMRSIQSEMIEIVRGKGLLNAVAIKPTQGRTAWDVCLAMKENGLIAKPTHENIIRFTPPLVINKEQMMEAIGIIKKTFKETGI
jgi:ornithine--oxo-acid transaminase